MNTKMRQLGTILFLSIVVCFWLSGCRSFTIEEDPLENEVTVVSPQISPDLTSVPSFESTISETPTITTVPQNPPTKIAPTITPVVPSLPSQATPSANPLMKVEELQLIGGRRISLSEDGTLIATALLTKTEELAPTTNSVQIYDLASQRLIHTLEIPSAPVIGTNALAFSPDGSLIAAAGLEEAVFVWDTGTGELVYELPFGSVIYRVSFSSDNKFLAITTPGERGSVVVWELDTGEIIEYSGTIPGIDISFIPNTTTLAIALANQYPEMFDEGIILLWNWQRGETEIVFTGQAGEGIAVSPDGSILVAKIDGYLRLWDLHRNVEIEVENNDPDFGLVHIVFSKQRTLAVLDPGITSLITLWNIEGQFLAQIQEEGIQDIAFAPNGYVISSKPNEPMTIWEILIQ